MTHQPNGKPRVLIVAHTTTFLTELSLLGDLLRSRTDSDVIFYCAFAHWTADEFAKTCAAEAVACLREPLMEHLARHFGKNAVGRAQVAGPSGLIARVIEPIAASLPGIGPGFLAEKAAFSVRANEINTLLAAVQPKLLVLGGDMPGYDTSLFVKLAHAAGIPVLVVPSTMSNGLEQAEVYYGDPGYVVEGWQRNLIAALFPKWVRRHKDKRLFRCPPGRLLAMESIGIAPPQPWIFNSGHADVIAMESQAMIDYYADAGMKNDRMKLLGTLSDDAMASRIRDAVPLRNELCRQLNLDPAKRMFLTALPPDFLYVTGGRPQCDFQDFRKLVEFWIDSLAGLKDSNCVVALHPSVDVEEMRWIERPGLRIAPWKTANVVPLCDVYVASISSTIRWAIACGKPVVNYDVYRYRYTDFLGVPGVIATEEQGEFRAILNRLANDAQYSGEVAAVQAQHASRWGLTDGHVGDRMLAEVERLCGIVADRNRQFGTRAVAAN